MSFTPFDDALTTIRPTRPTQSGSTYPYDHLRQGVEMTSTKHLYNGTQPKLWAGADNFSDVARGSNLVDHGIKITTYGQSVGFIDYDGHSLFEDIPKFDSTLYVEMGGAIDFGAEFNEGPMQQQEAIIEPLVIPFRLPTNEGPEYSHKIWGQLEDGNNFLDSTKSSNRIQQFIELKSSETPSFFLDSGGSQFGGIILDGYSVNTKKINRPFDDTQQKFVVNSIQTTDQTLISRLYDLDINLDDDIRPFETKSACAGFIFIGSAGTDSIAFGGTTRGV